LQLQGRTFFLEAAASRAVSSDRRLRRTDAVDDDGRGGAACADGARIGGRSEATAGQRGAWTTVHPDRAAELVLVLHGRLDQSAPDVRPRPGRQPAALAVDSPPDAETR